MKAESITGAVVKLRNSLQPKYTDNVSPMLYDYDFFTKLESFVKKEREKAKQKCIEYADKPDTASGVLIETPTQQFVLKVSNASPAFSIDKFMEAVSREFDIPKHKLKELATDAVMPGTPRKTYSVEQKDQ